MGLANPRPRYVIATEDRRKPARPAAAALRPGIAFTAVAETDGGRVLVSCSASSIDEAMRLAKRLVAEASSEALKFEMREEDDGDEEKTQILWEAAVERARASISSVSLWVGRHDRVPPCPPIGAFA